MSSISSCAFLIILFFIPLMSHGLVDSNYPGIKDISWKEITTEHFYIIVDEKHLSLGKDYARKAEEAYQWLKPIFPDIPKKTTLVVRDNTDVANGYATFLPYPTIVVFPVLPRGLDSVSHYDDWVRELVVHEYTHILNFEPTHSFYTPLRYIFGSLIRPAALLPRWWQEGLAVEMETRFTNMGRLRSPGAFASLRALALGDQLTRETLDRVNESGIPEWPFGQRPYLLGSMMWAEILVENDISLVTDLLNRYARRIPFFLNAPLEDETGAGYVRWHQDAVARLNKALKQQIHKIKSTSKQKKHTLPLKGLNHHSPAFSPNGQYMAVIGSELYKGSSIHILQRDKKGLFTEVTEHSVAGKGFTHISWLPDSSGLLFDRLGTYKRYQTFRDLYLFDLETKKTQQLTKGYRASHPTPSPDGKKVAFIQTEPGRTSLHWLDREMNKTELLFRPKLGVRISTPLFISDNEILFAGRSLEGIDKFYIINTKSKKRSSVLKDFSGVQQPVSTTKGILFASNRSGTSNLYLTNGKFSKTIPLTNSATEILNGAIDPKNKTLYISELTSKGTKIKFIDHPKKMVPAKIKSPLRKKWSPPPKVNETKVDDKNISDYSSLRYMIPTYWIPFIYPLENGMLFQGSTEMSDPLGRHSYLLNLSFDTETEEMSYGVSYLNSVSPIGVSMYYTKNHEPLTGTNVVLANQTGGLNMSFYIPGLSNSWSGYFGGIYNHTDFDSYLTRAGPTTGMGYSGLTDNISGNVEKGGGSFSLSHTEFLGDEKEQLVYGRSTFTSSYNLNHFLPLRHNFIWQLKGAFSPQLSKTAAYFVGEKTMGGNYLASLINSNYLMRGYPSGTFFGRKILNLNVEYKFPLSDIYRGRGTAPFFLRNLNMTFFVDGVAVDGGFVNETGPFDNGTRVEENFTELDRQFFAGGVEFNLHTTLGYHFPVDFILGLYQGFDEEAMGDFTVFLGIGYSGHGGLTENPKLRHWNRN